MSQSQRNRLRVKRLDKIAFVDAGDNPRAHIAIVKRAPDAEQKAGQAGVVSDDGWVRKVVAAVGRLLGRSEQEVIQAMDEAPTVSKETKMADAKETAVKTEVENKDTASADVVKAQLEHRAGLGNHALRPIAQIAPGRVQAVLDLCGGV